MRIKINLSFILFLFLSFYLGYYQYILIIFISVLLHELGHSYTAKLLGIDVYEVQLFPFGGIAIMENITKYGGYKEIIISIAGPIVSLVIGMFFFYCNSFFIYSSLVYKYNFALFLFNLLPALPLDGGRIVRNLLLYKTSYKKATKIMTINGKILANILVLLNIRYLLIGSRSISLIISGIFIFFGAIKEERNSSYVSLLNRNNKKLRMINKKGFSYRIIKVSGETYIKSIVDQFSPINACRIQVYDERGSFLAELCEADIMNAFLKNGYYSKVKDI